MIAKKQKELTPTEIEEIRTKDFFDCILPGTVKFFADHYILGDSYRCVWAVREYPPSTEEQAILSQLADRNGVTLRIYHRLVESIEQRKIIQNATRRNKMKSTGNDMNDTIEAEGNLKDVVELLANLRKNREPLLHCAVYIELKAKSMDTLKELQSDISMELTRSKISVDRLTLRQKEGFLSVLPIGSNQFGTQYERVLPASSVANLYPFNFSGKTDPQGLYIGRDKFGTNILADFDRRAEDKTTSNILILGNSGQGKSYLLKLIITNIRESGKHIICLDPEGEYKELCDGLGGCYIDFLSGEYTINPLEPKAWSEQAASGSDNDGVNMEVSMQDGFVPDAFKKATKLSQHIAFLKDFFRSYKDFSDAQIDTIEILLTKLYARFGITDATDYGKKLPTDFPIMQDFYKLCEEEFMTYDICYDILDLGKQLLPIGMLVVLDSILNRITANRAKGKNTFIIIDEIYLLFQHEYSANFLFTLWKRVRKYGAFCTGITQNVDDLLQSHTARTMLANSEFVIMLNQASTDRIKLAELLNISDTQISYITNVEAGRGLMKVGSALVPFVNKFPKNTQLYRLMTTKLSEVSR